MRVAVLISGQLRNWRISRDNQLWFWTTMNIPDVQVDYFTHTWTYSQDREGVTKPYVTRDISEEEYNEFIDFYKPKGHKIDSLRTKDFVSNDHWSSLFYSYAQTLALKREYEIENNFTYDLVIKSRPDVVFDPSTHCEIPSKLHDGCIFTTFGGPMPMEFNIINFNDCVFLGNSYTMDLTQNIYFFRQYYVNDKFNHSWNVHPLGPGTLLHEFFREYGITPYFRLGWMEILTRGGCPEDLNLFEFPDYVEMKKYFMNWYKS